MKKVIILVILCLAASALSGCNSTAGSTRTNGQSSSRSVLNSAADNSESVIEYAATNEILNAKFNSGLVQLNNDVFQQGGYITVEDFVEKYKDRYSIRYHYPEDENYNKISPYEKCKNYLVEYKNDIYEPFFHDTRWGERISGLQGSKWRNYLELTPKYGNTENIVKAYVINATSKVEKTTLNKAIIAAVDSYNGELGFPSYAAPEWFPKGLNYVNGIQFKDCKNSNHEYSLSIIPQMLEAEDITERDGIGVKKSLNKFWKSQKTNGHDIIRAYVVGEQNVFGVKPVFCCEFEFDPNTDKVRNFTETLGFFLEE